MVRRRIRWAVALGLIVAGTAAAAPIPTADPAGRERTDPREFERLGQWDRACAAYSQLLAADRHQPEIRQRLANCLRHWRQSRRHSDAVYRSFAAKLPPSQALTLYSDVVATLQLSYVDSAKVSIECLYRAGLEELTRALSDPAFVREQLVGVSASALGELRERLARAGARRIPADAGELRQAIRDLAWDLQHAAGLPPGVAILECAYGACHALDEVTVLWPAGFASSDAEMLSAELSMYGFSFCSRGGLIVERVAAGSWAYQQGVRPGDRIVRVGRTPLHRLSLESVADVLAGERPAIRELTIADASGPRTLELPEQWPGVLEISLERDVVGVVRIASFHAATPQEFDSAVLRLRAEGARALVLDLRGNPGGSFSAAVQIAERFLGDAVIVSTVGQLRGLSRVFRSQNSAPLDFPLVVLADGETASAAEVLAGALKDQNRAVIVGQPTYGKDSIQRLIQLSEGSALRLTLARFLLPAGKPLAGIGVAPHVWEPRRDALHDWQLDAAIEQALRMLALR